MLLIDLHGFCRDNMSIEKQLFSPPQQPVIVTDLMGRDLVTLENSQSALSFTHTHIQWKPQLDQSL